MALSDMVGAEVPRGAAVISRLHLKMILIHPPAANSAGSLHFAAVLLSITVRLPLGCDELQILK